MFSTRRLIAIVLLLTLVLSSTAHSPVQAQSNAGYVRGANFLTGGPKLDIYIDGQAVLTSISYQDTSPYAALTPGKHNIGFGSSAKGQPIGNSILVEVNASDVFTFVVSGNAAVAQGIDAYVTSETGILKQQNVSLTSDSVPFLFIQGSKDVASVDLYVNDKLVGNVQSGYATAFVMPLPAGKINVTAAGDANTTLASTSALALLNTIGVLGLTGNADKLSLDVAYSTPANAAQFLDAQKTSPKASFNSLLKAANAAKLTDTLNGAGPLTLFAPLDTAFTSGVGDAAAQDKLFADTAKIADVVKYHLIGEYVTLNDITDGIAAGGLSKATLQGANLTVAIKDNGLIFGEQPAALVAYSIHTANAIIHILDTVLFPVGFKK